METLHEGVEADPKKLWTAFGGPRIASIFCTIQAEGWEISSFLDARPLGVSVGTSWTVVSDEFWPGSLLEFIFRPVSEPESGPYMIDMDFTYTDPAYTADRRARYDVDNFNFNEYLFRERLVLGYEVDYWGIPTFFDQNL